MLDPIAIPGLTSKMSLFVQLVDGIGRYDITVRIDDLANDRIVARGTGPRVFFPDPLTIRQFTLPITALPIEHPGSYDVIVLADNQEIDRQQFIVAEADGHQEGER